MKIVSENPKILDELFDELDIDGFDVDKVAKSEEDGGMGVLATIALILGIGVSLIKIYEFLEKHFPDWKIVFEPFKSDEIEMTVEKYESLSENARKAILSKYKIIIKQK